MCASTYAQVVIARWRAALPSFEDYQRDPTQLKPSHGHPGCLVDNWTPHMRKTPPMLTNEIKRMTSRACPVCDRRSVKPFQTASALLRHMDIRHTERLCSICVMVRCGVCEYAQCSKFQSA